MPIANDPLDMLSRVAAQMKKAVSPYLGKGREVDGIASSGDTTFKLDTIAEKALEEALAQVGYEGFCYSEDRGLITVGRGGTHLLVVDPVDGTRPAVAGFESCCLSLALAEKGTNSCLGDVRCGWIEELKHPLAHYACREGGATILHRDTGKEEPCSPSGRENAQQLFFSVELVARPAHYVMTVLEELIDGSTLDGGCFLFNSSAYSLTRLATGQLDAHIDVGARILQELPGAREAFLKAGKGRIITLFPYDIAAAKLIAERAGCVVTDASGKSLDGYPLLMPEDHPRLGILAACSSSLHEELLDRLNHHMKRAL